MELAIEILYSIVVAAVAAAIGIATYYFGRVLGDSPYARVWRIQYLVPTILGLAIVCEIIGLSVLRIRSLLILAGLLVFLYVSYKTVHFMQEYVQAQKETISGLSLPTIRVSEGILVMPLIGVLDSVRAGQVMETLLEETIKNEVKAVIIDVTGISTIDTQVANHLVRMIRALRLMGTQSIITGIRPDVSVTMAQQDIGLGDVVALRNVQQALEHIQKGIQSRNMKTR